MKYILYFFVLPAFLLIVSYFGFSRWYLWNENQNFKLLRKKSELNCTTMPYHCAISRKKIEDIKILKEQLFDINSRDLWLQTALIFAVRNNLPGTEELIKNGADVNLFDEHGESALSYSLRNKNFLIADFLIKNGADLNFKIQTGKKNMTLLTEAISQKNTEVANYLVQKGADLKLKDDYGYDACERVKMYQVQNEMKFIDCSKQ